jgi:hypothetical protein
MQPLVHLIEADSCPQTWLKAVEYLSSNHDFAYNLVLGVRRPEVLTPADFGIHDVVDGFLREHGRPPLTTIAGTIFPANLYLHGGAEELYSYPQIYPRIHSQWGLYAIRLLRKSTYRRGNGQAEINPLQIIVEKMKKQLAGGRMRAVYEANLVDGYRLHRVADLRCGARCEGDAQPALPKPPEFQAAASRLRDADGALPLSLLH